MRPLFLSLLLPFALIFSVAAQAEAPATTGPMTLLLPTDNDKLLRDDGPGFYMYVDRNFENQKTTPWEGGQYGYVRGPVRIGNRVALMAFHEGLDIAPLKRDAQGEPLDVVKSMSPGEVVHAATNASASNYGRYVVIKHDWGQGPFYSLYAHLAKITVQPGQVVQAGSPIGIMGHTGSGLDRRRSHLHVELNVMLSTRFPDWHARHFKPSVNHHGVYNGINLSGMDLAKLFLARQVNPMLTAADFMKSMEVEWKVIIPRKGELELLKRYPWMGDGVNQASPSWEISLASSGLPLSIKPSMRQVSLPQVGWVKDQGIPHGMAYRGYISGSGNSGTLTASGGRFVELLSGSFPVVNAAAVEPAAAGGKPGR